MGLKKQIKEFIQDELELDAHSQEVEELKNKIENSEDFYIKIDGQEYRFISEFKIWDIYVEKIKNITLDCYDLKLPDFLAIDWEKTAQNCSVDGYGHIFARYDGEELEHRFEGELYYIFRIN